MSEAERKEVQGLPRALIAGPLLFALVLGLKSAGLQPEGWSDEAMVVGGLTLWMGTWWIF